MYSIYYINYQYITFRLSCVRLKLPVQPRKFLNFRTSLLATFMLRKGGISFKHLDQCIYFKYK